ncbi:MAG: capsule biosynthesis protein CapK, partial [Azoarcus sp.]|nr:capsule biosynthesis protein CapK [Azoarcus sp.]
DVSHCLAPFALPQYTLHQHADLGLTLRARVLDQEARLAAALRKLFGDAIRIEMASLPMGDKLIQYTSDVPQP